MSGFEGDLKDNIRGANAEMVVSRADGKLKNDPTLLAKIEAVPGVVAVSPFFEQEVAVKSASAPAGAILRGSSPTASNRFPGSPNWLRVDSWNI